MIIMNLVAVRIALQLDVLGIIAKCISRYLIVRRVLQKYACADIVAQRIVQNAIVP